MSELRWILLLVGVLFLVALTAWESRRSRLARAAARERARALAETIPFDRPGAGSAAELAGAGAGPALGELSAAAVEELAPAARFAAPGAGDGAIRAERRAGSSGGAALELPSVPMEPRFASGAAPRLEAQAPDEGPAAELRREEEAVPEIESDPDPDPESEASPPAAEALSSTAQSGVSVEWPPEEQRHIVSVRIVSTSEQRLSGRATRQALAACGFVHGRYRIFHQPDDRGQALLSCASLNKPGVFDPSSMDYQRYSGLSLFTVLPGPLSPPEAVERLLHTALDLSERLRARLQDDAGQTLDEARIAQLRTRYRELDAMAGPPA